MNPADKTCELCDRHCPKHTEHHLIPRQQTKRKKKTKNKYNHTDLGPTIDICPPCHSQIHTLFTTKELAAELSIDGVSDEIEKDLRSVGNAVEMPWQTIPSPLAAPPAYLRLSETQRETGLYQSFHSGLSAGRLRP